MFQDPLEDQIMENRRRPHKEIQGAVCANEDEQTHDLAELSLYDVLHKSGKDQEAERAELTAGKNQCENAIEANERINDEVLNEKVR